MRDVPPGIVVFPPGVFGDDLLDVLAPDVADPEAAEVGEMFLQVCVQADVLPDRGFAEGTLHTADVGGGGRVEGAGTGGTLVSGLGDLTHDQALRLSVCGLMVYRDAVGPPVYHLADIPVPAFQLTYGHALHLPLIIGNVSILSQLAPDADDVSLLL